MRAFSLTAEVRNGKIPDSTRRIIADAIAKNEGKSVTVSVKRFVKTISTNQNRFMHGPFFIAMQQAHFDSGEVLNLDQVKERFKEEFGVKETIRRIDGTYTTQPKSTKEYTTIECEESMERARAHYSQFGHELPFPNEHLREVSDE